VKNNDEISSGDAIGRTNKTSLELVHRQIKTKSKSDVTSTVMVAGIDRVLFHSTDLITIY